MPIKRCQKDKKKGYKAGKTGKCFRSRSKAVKQLRAIKASQRRKNA